MAVRSDANGLGPWEMRPHVSLGPTRPLYDAGMRMEPPPSDPVQKGTRPAATAAAEPPDDPPGVWSTLQGLRVVPCKSERVKDSVPNSGAAVRPTQMAPAALSRVTCVESSPATRSAKTRDASV